MINDILDFSKIEAGRMEIEAIDFDMHSMVEQASALLAEHAHKKGLELGVNFGAGCRRPCAATPGA